MECWQQESFDIKSQADIDRLNAIFKALSPEERIKALYANNDLRQKNIILTSSFGTTAVYLLHLYYKMNIRQEVYFLDTTFHFDETIVYKNKLKQMFDLEVKELHPEDWKNAFTRENKLWKSDPDLCCSVNKVEPMLQIKQEADIWVSGLMGWQNEHRKNLDIFQVQDGTLKFYPIIDVKEEDVKDYLIKWALPVHPLKPLGYESIGCKHCTFKGRGRAGRWSGQAKTECGLHQ
ncbi:phosphoadenylyl-sulfate reductase [Porifericola rhodea]|uniref:phosphoadenylyl-sulfate reductase n=1 Tax=Porifericola rhodea TaxID=930972 RepID=UPI002666C977|nr:phosphoadenylyl-sulfate reductase [Porifericola rhodea]WKN30443.1 phosphoadenylyl-sulfate reductase [Porifericola rhodea]